MSGAGSPGQQVWTGSRPRSMASPGQHDFLAGCCRNGLGPHGHGALEEGQHLQRLAPAAGRLGLLQEGEGPAELAKLVGLALHAQSDALHRAEEIDQHRHVVATAIGPDDVLEQHRRPALGQQAGLDLGHFQDRADRLGHAQQQPVALQAVDEIA